MIHVALASDNGYAQHLAVTIKSVLNSNTTKVCFHIMDTGIEPNNLNEIKKLIEDSNSIYKIYNFRNLEEKIGFVSRSSVLPISAYARIFLPPMLNRITDRIIYMDVDIVNVYKLDELYNLDMNDCIIAGVQDFAGKEARIKNGYTLSERYINSGVLLIDINKWNEYKVTDKVHNYIIERNGYVAQEDQGAINAVLKDKIYILPPKFNAMTPFFFVKSNYIKNLFDIQNYYNDIEIKEAKKTPVLIHFLKFNGYVARPWEKGCAHPRKNDYLDTLKETAWKDYQLVDDKRTVKQKIRSMYYLHIRPLFY